MRTKYLYDDCDRRVHCGVRRKRRHASRIHHQSPDRRTDLGEPRRSRGLSSLRRRRKHPPDHRFRTATCWERPPTTAFGETVAESGDMKTTYRFRGQQGFSTDPLTGDVSKANQNYSPPIGRRLGNPNPEYSVATAWEADSISTTSAWPQSTRGYVCGGTSSSPWIDPYHGGLAGGVGTILGGERIGTINASAAIGISSGGSKKFDCRQAYVTLTLSLSSTRTRFLNISRRPRARHGRAHSWPEQQDYVWHSGLYQSTGELDS